MVVKGEAGSRPLLAGKTALELGIFGHTKKKSLLMLVQIPLVSFVV